MPVIDAGTERVGMILSAAEVRSMEEYTEALEAIVDSFAERLEHEACRYTAKATYPEIAHHLIHIQETGDRAACRWPDDE